MIVIVQVEI